jgi:hypothetical protein
MDVEIMIVIFFCFVSPHRYYNDTHTQPSTKWLLIIILYNFVWVPTAFQYRSFFIPPTGRRSRTQRPEFLKDWQPEISRFLCGLKYSSLFRVSSCQKGLTSQKRKKCPQNNKTRVVWHARAFESPAPFSSKKKRETQ